MESFEFFFREQNKITEYYEPGEYLYKNGTPALGIFFICSGKVQVIMKTDSGFLTQEIKSAGDILAMDEMDLLYYASDAIALEFTEVNFYDRYYLKELEKK